MIKEMVATSSMLWVWCPALQLRPWLSIPSATSSNPLSEVEHSETKCYVEMGEGRWVSSDRFPVKKNVRTYTMHVIILGRIQLGHNYGIMVRQLSKCCTALKKN